MLTKCIGLLFGNVVASVAVDLRTGIDSSYIGCRLDMWTNAARVFRGRCARGVPMFSFPWLRQRSIATASKFHQYQHYGRRYNDIKLVSASVRSHKSIWGLLRGVDVLDGDVWLGHRALITSDANIVYGSVSIKWDYKALCS